MIIQCLSLTFLSSNHLFTLYDTEDESIANRNELDTMMSTYCLRLARRPAALQVSNRALRSAVPLAISDPIRTFRRGNSNRVSRFSDANNESSTVSPFKLQRQDQLREDQTSEDPLYSESYPRLPSSETRQAVPEFIESFDKLPAENVTLSGRVRSKRVVGKSLIFVDIVNEFQKVQVMINKKKVIPEDHRRISKFALFKNLIQVGDHVCMSYLPPVPCLP